MILRDSISCVLILIYCVNIAFGKVCDDCQAYTDCPAAYKIVDINADANTTTEFKSLYCGVEYNKNGDRIVQVCCSDFDEDNLERHPNQHLLPSNCGYADVYPMDRLSLYEFPWIAAINFTINRFVNFPCDGVIINSRYILTTAYCAKKHTPAFVRVGDFNPDTDMDCSPSDPRSCEDYKQDIFIEEVVAHPNASLTLPDIKNDIALIRLKNEIDFSHRNVAPICLPLSRASRVGMLGKSGIVAGWEFKDGNRNFSNFLKLPATFQEEANCTKTLFRNRPNATLEGFLCTKISFAEKHVCNAITGDGFVATDLYKGVYRHILYGVYSHGTLKCLNLPDVFVDISKYMKWILDNLQP